MLVGFIFTHRIQPLHPLCIGRATVQKCINAPLAEQMCHHDRHDAGRGGTGLTPAGILADSARKALSISWKA